MRSVRRRYLTKTVSTFLFHVIMFACKPSYLHLDIYIDLYRSYGLPPLRCTSSKWVEDLQISPSEEMPFWRFLILSCHHNKWEERTWLAIRSANSSSISPQTRKKRVLSFSWGLHFVNQALLLLFFSSSSLYISRVEQEERRYWSSPEAVCIPGFMRKACP